MHNAKAIPRHAPAALFLTGMVAATQVRQSSCLLYLQRVPPTKAPYSSVMHTQHYPASARHAVPGTQHAESGCRTSHLN